MEHQINDAASPRRSTGEIEKLAGTEYQEELAQSLQQRSDNEHQGREIPKLDKHGFALVPQPSGNPDDPLNWSPTLKLLVALQVSWLAFLGPMASAVANPAFVLLGAAFDITPVEASYSLTVYICFAGIGPLLLIPFANIYGRRPVYLVSALIAAVTNIAAGYSKTWSGILSSRAINGIFGGTPPAIGAATICDLYFMHERGFYMGIFTLFLTNGPHVAPLMGGFIAQYLGWEWCYRIPVSETVLHGGYCKPCGDAPIDRE